MSVIQNKKKPLVVLTGPTAVGKTKLSIALAKAINGEILSADSMQVYKHMDIGSAKIRPEEMEGVPHHLIDILEPWEEFNVVVFQKHCLECMEQIYDRSHIPILVGGTGFYIQAVLRGIDFTENEENTEYRKKLELLAEEQGPESLHEMLKKVDPVSAENIHANNIKRTIRALEYYELTGEPISVHNEREKERTSPYNFSYFVLPDGSFDYDKIRENINEKTHLVTIQRSKGYQTRPTLSVQRIGELIAFIKGIKPDVICMVDNCYGEFVETIEPSDVGADMIVGSLIKNPGGGLAPIGGYIAGKKECVENAAYRLTSPGLGKEVGASLGILKDFYQGFFLAPTVTAGALKGAIFAANVYEKLGFAVVPNGSESRHDIIQAVTFGQPEGVIGFCQGIQAAAPVDSHVTPESWDMPGYDAQVIMAAGAFVSGSSIELSADGPIKPPYAVYFQGGLTWQHAKFGILKSLQVLVQKGLVTEEQIRKACRTTLKNTNPVEKAQNKIY